MTLSFDVEPRGKKFATVCREDGFWVTTFLSKNTRAANRKGDDYVAGRRSGLKTYVTEAGEAMNTYNSLPPSHRGDSV